ncbi:MAG TPA: hypothetical protein VGC42_09245 [Kofleriaceae bacterium]
MRMRCAILWLAACGGPATAPRAPAPLEPFTTAVIALPGGGPDGVAMDYLAFDPRTHAVWVPAGNTGAVDVVDVATGKVSQLGGFATQELEVRGKLRRVGPSAAAIGPPGTVYVGSRGDRSICAIDEVALTRRTCATLDAMPDGIAYVARTQEVWVTTPRDRSIRILDATSLAQKARLAFDGAPEGFAADNTRGRFYTNLEDKDQTLAIDLASRATVATWAPRCGEDGPHGLRLAEAEGFLLVACDDRITTFDVAHGTPLGAVDTGKGVDDFDYDPASHRVYAGGAEAGSLTIASLAPTGALTRLATIPTRPGARNGVVTATGQVYLAHARGSELVVITPASPAAR